MVDLFLMVAESRSADVAADIASPEKFLNLHIVVLDFLLQLLDFLHLGLIRILQVLQAIFLLDGKLRRANRVGSHILSADLAIMCLVVKGLRLISERHNIDDL